MKGKVTLILAQNKSNNFHIFKIKDLTGWKWPKEQTHLAWDLRVEPKVHEQPSTKGSYKKKYWKDLLYAR